MADAAPWTTPTQALSMPLEASAAGHAWLPQAAGTAHDAARSTQGFRVGPHAFMVEYAEGSELGEVPPLHRLPNAPAWFAGVANLHGALTPVFDLARWLGDATDPAARRMLLVLLHGADAFGVLIDGLPVRLRLAREQERAADPATVAPRLRPHVRGAALVDGRLWFGLDVPGLASALEQSMHLS